jgi:hypothetical protein
MVQETKVDQDEIRYEIRVFVVRRFRVFFFLALMGYDWLLECIYINRSATSLWNGFTLLPTHNHFL